MPIFANGQIVRPRVQAVRSSGERIKAQKVFDFIVAFKREHDGNSPTMREIMANCKITSSSMAFFYLNQLAAAGLIRRPEPEIGTRQAANIEVVGGKWIFIGGKHG
jgi:SOS-response transcriptional repressor LexA